MADQKFDSNLLQVAVAAFFSLLSLQTSHEMFGKSYFALGIGEKMAVDQAAFLLLQGNYRGLTPEFWKNLSGQTTQPSPAGVVPPTTSEEKKP